MLSTIRPFVALYSLNANLLDSYPGNPMETVSLGEMFFSVKLPSKSLIVPIGLPTITICAPIKIPSWLVMLPLNSIALAATCFFCLIMGLAKIHP